MRSTPPPSTAASSLAQPAPFDLYLVENRRRFHEVLNQRSALVLVLDERGTLRYANPLARRAFRTFTSPLRGCSVFSMVHRSDLCALMRRLDRLATTETDVPDDCLPPSPLLLRLFTRRDRWRWFEASLLRFSYRAEAEEHVLAVTLTSLPSA